MASQKKTTDVKNPVHALITGDARKLAEVIADALDDVKGNDIVTLDVRGLAGFTDFMVLASGTSNRHVKSLAERAQERMRELGIKPIGLEGEQTGEWVLVDFGDVVVHVMLPETRKFYDLERLWHNTIAAPAGSTSTTSSPSSSTGQGTH